MDCRVLIPERRSKDHLEKEEWNFGGLNFESMKTYRDRTEDYEMNSKMAIEKHCLSDALEGTSTHWQNVIKNKERNNIYRI